MLTLTILLTSLLQAGPSADELKRMRLITDGSGHYIAFDDKEFLRQPYFGDGKSFWALRTPGGGGTTGENWSINLWEPRLVNYATVEMQDANAKFSVTCGEKVTPFKLLSQAEGDKMLAAAKFVEHPFMRRPERLLRDDAGTYYFVDRLRADGDERRDFTFYMGPRGALKLVKLKDLVDDSEGLILATKDGSLRLIAGRADGKAETKWISGKKNVNLIEVPLDEGRNVRLIYNELGVYSGKPLGTPCDGLM